MVARANTRRDPPPRPDRTAREPSRSSKASEELYGGASLDDLEKALVIGNDLEQADREQAEAYWRVARASAIATSRRDAAYQNIKDVEAEESLKIRDSYTKEDKVTEGTITAEVRTSPNVRAAYRDHLVLQEQAAILQALTRSFDMRSYALKDLVLMHLREFSMQNGKAGDAMADDIRRRRAEERDSRGYADRDEDRHDDANSRRRNDPRSSGRDRR